MAEFESWKQLSEFSWFIMRKSRHILDAANRKFLDAVVATSQNRKGTIQKGCVLQRAQLGHAWETEILRDVTGTGKRSI